MISIAMTLIGDANLIILDEPTANLDPVSRFRVWEALLSIKKKITHYENVLPAGQRLLENINGVH